MSSAPPLAKYLASTEKSVRDKAIKNLSAFLSDDSRNDLVKADMDKLWKGIFYGFWMSDKPLVQQKLAVEIADILLTIHNTTSSLNFLHGFWQTIVREWSGIDRLRIDKYYMLIRRFVNASFRLLVRAEWDRGTLNQYNSILTAEGGPLCTHDIKVPTGIVYHLSDIYLEELDKVFSLPADQDSTPPAPLYTLLSPFLVLLARTPSSVTYKRIQSALLEPLFSALNDKDEPVGKRARSTSATDSYSNVVSNACYEDYHLEGEISGSRLREKLLRSVFEMASETETRDSNRRRMYALWRDRSDDEGGMLDV